METGQVSEAMLELGQRHRASRAGGDSGDFWRHGEALQLLPGDVAASSQAGSRVEWAAASTPPFRAAILHPLRLSHLTAAATSSFTRRCHRRAMHPVLRHAAPEHRAGTRPGSGSQGHSNAGRQQRSGAAVPRFALRAPPPSCPWDGSGVSSSGGGSDRGPAAFLTAGAATDQTVAPASAARRGPGPGSPAWPPGGRGAGSGRSQPTSGERTQTEEGRCTGNTGI